MPQPLTAILIGAGNRGQDAYGAYSLTHPDEIRFVAVAEPKETRRSRFAAAHGLPAERQYRTWEDLLAHGKIADAAVICTLDTQHVAPTIAALEAGYDVLLEKPMATTLSDCVHLVQAAERSSRSLHICHELRYTPFFTTIRGIVKSGRLGRVITVEHRENVSYWHMAHSYVRGNWRSSKTESPMILAKCCHDLDILFWILGPCQRLNSFGSLIHYRPENAPTGAPQRCTDGCPAAATCPWYAPRLYLDIVPLLHVARESAVAWERLSARLVLDHPALAKAITAAIPPLARALDYRGWPVSIISDDTSREARLRALQDGPYGRCVYHCDNDVVDHQTVNMELEDGTSVVLFMHGHSHREGRTLRYDGTRATLLGHYYPIEQKLEIHDHQTGEVEVIRIPLGPIGASGHGSADAQLMAAFVHAVREPGSALTTARQSLESHLLAFAAEQARLTSTVVDMAEFRHTAEQT